MHGTAVTAHGFGLLLVGPSGSGKSTLALQMMSLGAGLISDDIVALDQVGSVIAVAHPKSTSEVIQIEARGFGILNSQAEQPKPLKAVVDLGHVSQDRLPKCTMVQLGDVPIPLFHKVETPAFPAVLMHYLQNGTANDL